MENQPNKREFRFVEPAYTAKTVIFHQMMAGTRSNRSIYAKGYAGVRNAVRYLY